MKATLEVRLSLGDLKLMAKSRFGTLWQESWVIGAANDPYG